MTRLPGRISNLSQGHPTAVSRRASGLVKAHDIEAVKIRAHVATQEIEMGKKECSHNILRACRDRQTPRNPRLTTAAYRDAVHGYHDMLSPSSS